jgi:DnaJ-class molecular chaperone
MGFGGHSHNNRMGIMTVQEAWNIMAEISSLQDKLRESFPCDECSGQGTKTPNWYGYNPCDACYGEGWSVPNEWDGE